MGRNGQLAAWKAFSPLFRCANQWSLANQTIDGRIHAIEKAKDWTPGGRSLLQAEALVHQPLQARLVEDIVGEFLVREHCQRGSFRTGH